MGESKLTVVQVNEILEDISIHNFKNKFILVAEERDDDYGEELGQCNFSYRRSIFKLGIDDLHIKVTEETDSYGDCRGIRSIKIVRPIVKQITDFE